MDIENMIGNYAFPICACIAMAAFIYLQYSTNNKNIPYYIGVINELVDKFISALDRNTESISKLEDMIERMIQDDNTDE